MILSDNENYQHFIENFSKSNWCGDIEVFPDSALFYFVKLEIFHRNRSKMDIEYESDNSESIGRKKIIEHPTTPLPNTQNNFRTNYMENAPAKNLTELNQVNSVIHATITSAIPLLRHFITDLPSKRYTLVLDLDETLVHFKNENGKAKFLIRPYVYNLLKNLSTFYELIIFTAAQKEYADWILDKIDSKKSISHRLYREHCVMSRTSHLKVK